MIVILAIMLSLCSVAEARLPVDYATVTINGEEIEFPVGNKERREEVFYLKKALNGDKEAREVFLGGKDEKWFFIGEESAKWLKITKDSELVVIP